MLAHALRLLAARRPAAPPEPPSAGADDDADADAFRCRTGPEIGALLGALRDAAVPVTLGAPGGASVSAVVGGVDAARARLTFDVESADPGVERLVGADEASAVAYLESVKVQFDVTRMVLVRGPRRGALQCAWPASVWRFQRRGAFRVCVPGDGAPSVTIQPERARTLAGAPATSSVACDAPATLLRLRLLDLSAGGCALLLPADAPRIAPGTELPGSVVSIDETLAFCVPLTVHHVSSLGAPAGALRLGCGFGRLTPEESRALQRHIDDTQRRRRLPPGE